MVIGYTAIKLGTVTLNLRNLTRIKVPGTIKMAIGGNLVRQAIPARTTRDWEISGDGVIFDTVLTAGTSLRTTLESYDDLNKRQYSDGLVSGSYIITDLTFSDKSDNPMHFEYKISLIQYQQ